jgi:hypothetical protein
MQGAHFQAESSNAEHRNLSQNLKRCFTKLQTVYVSTNIYVDVVTIMVWLENFLDFCGCINDQREIDMHDWF